MAKTPKLRLIRDKLRDILQEIAEREQGIAMLKVQASELEIAARVLESLSIGDDEEGDGEPMVAAVNGHAATESLRSPPAKPADIPTMPKMIIEALQDARKRGLRGLEPKDMTEYIKKKWWPDVPPESVGPIAWRMWKKTHTLTKRESKYFLPKQEDGSETQH